MGPFEDLANKTADEVAAMMAGSQEGSIARAFYMAEFIRRQTKAQVDAANTAKWSIVVACVAIVTAAVVQVGVALWPPALSQNSTIQPATTALTSSAHPRP
jgi:hypothetical protein